MINFLRELIKYNFTADMKSQKIPRRGRLKGFIGIIVVTVRNHKSSSFIKLAVKYL